jgi:hypothetical protein
MIDGHLALAQDLATTAAGDEIRLRRAVSTAYYGAFHALCAMVADTIASDVDRSLYVRLYRRADHNHLNAGKRLFEISEKTSAVRVTLDDLRQRRIRADYDPDPFGYSDTEVQDFVSKARQVVDLIRAFDERERRTLAINLLIGDSGERNTTAASRKAQAT